MEAFDQTINNLERFKERSPVLSSIWKNYLLIKKQHLEKQINSCNTMITMAEQDGVYFKDTATDNDLIIKCIPDIPDHIYIDEDNNIHIKFRYELFRKDKKTMPPLAA